MLKEQYSEDFHWYDQGVYNAITALDEKYPNAIPVFGGALGAYNYVNSETPNFEKFIKCLPEVAESAIFFKWHEGVVGALRRFCRLCHVDPALIELYMGMSFNEVAECI